MTRATRALLLVLVAVAAGCRTTRAVNLTDGGKDAAPRPDPFADYVPDPKVFAVAPDPAAMLTVTEDGGVYHVPADLLLLMLVPDAPAGTAERIAGALGGQVVGQVPGWGFYQLKLPTRTKEALDAALTQARADPAVAVAGYDLPTAGKAAACPPDSDNERLTGDDRCPFAHAEYYAALTLWEALRPSTHLVKVAVIDSGLAPACGEFNDTSVLNLDSPRNPPRDSTGHGTRVASLIAADDNQFVINGVASRFLGSDLALMVGDGTSVGLAIVSLARAVAAGAVVVNFSIGLEPTVPAVTRTTMAALWKSAFLYAPALLVAAAGNNRAVLTETNDPPAGIQVPNLITVGATQSCLPATPWSDSNTGPLVDLYAPGENVPSVTPEGVASPASGTSFATPLVTALAAILKSLNPSLTPPQLKTQLTTRAYPTNIAKPRLALAPAIFQLVTDLGAAEATVLDEDQDRVFDGCAAALVRLCNGLHVTYDSYGSFTFTKEETMGQIGPTSFQLTGVDSAATFGLDCKQCAFQLGNDFPLVWDASLVPGGAEGALVMGSASAPSIGNVTGGTWRFESCTVSERYPLNQAVMQVLVKGAVTGQVEARDPPNYDPPHMSDLEAQFSLEFNAIELAMSNDPLLQYLEQSCDGGTLHH
jgi:subtilisin family serine protease